MAELDRVMISRIDNSKSQLWRPISNPAWDYFTKAASMILDNEYNSYVEHENCGVVCRVVRRKNLSDYGIDPKSASGLSLENIGDQ